MDLDRIRRTYDTVAARYAAEIGDELDRKPLDRGLLEAFAAMCDGPIADLGCGPGHVTAFLAARHDEIVGIDLSPVMVAVAKDHHPKLPFVVGSLTSLPVPDSALAGAVALYSVIHLAEDARDVAYREMARAIRPGGRLLLAFHVETSDHRPGDVHHLTEWWGHEVDLDAFFLDPARELRSLAAAGFRLDARLDREPGEGEYPSRRSYLLLVRITP